jgi:DNA repair exonuclease SbcCD ATPase subunit
MADSRKDQSPALRSPASTLLAAETLRSSSSPAAQEEAKEEKRIPLVWRIFGGTVLSIGALIAITLYQQLHNKVETLADTLVKKQEFFDSRKGIWDHMEKLRAQGQSVDAEIQQRCARLEQQAKTSEEHHQEIVPELKQVREMLFTCLKESSGRLDRQVKAAEEERKKLLQEIQQLRDRLAALEAQKAPSSPVKTAVYEKKK